MVYVVVFLKIAKNADATTLPPPFVSSPFAVALSSWFPISFLFVLIGAQSKKRSAEGSDEDAAASPSSEKKKKKKKKKIKTEVE